MEKKKKKKELDALIPFIDFLVAFIIYLSACIHEFEFIAIIYKKLKHM